LQSHWNIASAPPWSVEDIGAAFVVKEGNGQQLAYVYYEEELGRLCDEAAHKG